MRTATAPRPARVRGTATTKVEWLPIGSLIVDPEIQRPFDENKAQKIADSLDPDVLGLIQVSARPNGVYHVMDGQHRVGALRLAGFDSAQQVLCVVAYDLDEAAEARRFGGFNTFTSPRAFDRFRVRIKEGDTTALGIDRVLMAHNWRVVAGNSPGCFSAVVAAERVYTGYGTAEKDRGPQNLHDALGVLTEAWGREPRAVHGALVTGLGLFFARYHGEVDKAALVRRLAQFAGGPDAYIGKARGIREFRGGVLARCVAELTVEVYNKRRSTGQLADWRS